jgi:uncharacterized protein YcbK (DUF882 family)
MPNTIYEQLAKYQDQTSEQTSEQTLPGEYAQDVPVGSIYGQLPDGFGEGPIPDDWVDFAATDRKTAESFFRQEAEFRGFPDDFLIINDIVLANVPTTAVGIESNNDVIVAETLRSRAPVVSTKGNQSIVASISLVFPTGREQSYKLRRLVSELQYQPLLYIYNGKIRKSLGVTDPSENTMFILETATMRSDPENVGSIILDMTVCYFNYKPFSHHFWYNTDLPWKKTTKQQGPEDTSANELYLGDLTSYEASAYSLEYEAEKMVRDLQEGTIALDSNGPNTPVNMPMASNSWLYYAENMYNKTWAVDEEGSDYVGFQIRVYEHRTPDKASERASAGVLSDIFRDVDEDDFHKYNSAYHLRAPMAGELGGKVASEREAEKILNAASPSVEGGRIPVTVINAASGEQAKLQLLTSDGSIIKESHYRFSELCYQRKNKLLYRDQGVLVDPELIRMVQKVGDEYPNKPLVIYSGIRNYNKGKGQHAKGRAIDFKVKGVSNRKLFIFIATTFKAGGAGYYPNNHPAGGSHFVHMDSYKDKGMRLWVDESGRGEKSRYNKDHELLASVRSSKNANNSSDLESEAAHLTEEGQEFSEQVSEMYNPDFDLNPQSIDPRPEEIIKEDYRKALYRANWITRIKESEGLQYYTDDPKIRNVFFKDIHCFVSSVPLLTQMVKDDEAIVADNMVASAISVTFGNRIVSQKLLSQDTSTWQFLGAGNKTGTLVFTFAGETGRKSADNIKKMIYHARRNARRFGSIIPEAGSMKLNWMSPDGAQSANTILALFASRASERPQPNMDIIVTDFAEQSDPNVADGHQLVINFIVQDFTEEKLDRNILTTFDQKRRVLSTIMDKYIVSSDIEEAPSTLLDFANRNNDVEELENGDKWIIAPNPEYIVYRNPGVVRRELAIQQKATWIGTVDGGGRPWEIVGNRIPAWLAPIIVEAVQITDKANKDLPSGYGVEFFNAFAAGQHMRGYKRNIAKNILPLREYRDPIKLQISETPEFKEYYKLHPGLNDHPNTYPIRYLEVKRYIRALKANKDKQVDKEESQRIASRVFNTWSTNMDGVFQKVMANATASDFADHFGNVGQETIDALVQQMGECYGDLMLPTVPDGNIPLPPDFYVYDDSHEDPALSTFTDDSNMELLLQQHIRNERKSVRHHMQDTILGGSYASRSLPHIMENRKHYLTQMGGETRDQGEIKFMNFSQMLAEGTMSWEPVFYRPADDAYRDEAAQKWVNRIIKQDGGSAEECRSTFMQKLVKLSPYINGDTRHWVTGGENISELVSDIYEDNWGKLAFGPNQDYKHVDTVMTGNIPDALSESARESIKVSEEQEQKQAIDHQQSYNPDQTQMADGSVTFGNAQAETDTVSSGIGNMLLDAGTSMFSFLLAAAETVSPLAKVTSMGISALVQSMNHTDAGELFPDDIEAEDRTRAKAAAAIAIGAKHKDLSVRRAFPTFKIYFIEDDEQGSEIIQGRTIRAFDDFYSYSAVQEIRVIRSRKIAADLAVLRITNIGGKLLRRRFGEQSEYERDQKTKHGIEAEYETNIFADTEKENPFERMILQDGVKVQIRLGYNSNPDHLDTVFLGSIVEITTTDDGKILELTCQGFGAELEGVELGPLEDGPLFYSSQQALSGAIIQDSIVNFGRRSKWNRFNSAEMRHQFTGGDGGGLLSAVNPASILANWSRSRQTRQIFKYPFKNYPQDDNIFAPPPHVYTSTWERFWDNACTYRPLKQTPWQIFKEHELRHPGYVSLAVPYGHSPRMTMFFGSKGQHYWKQPPTSLEIFLSESAASEIVRLRGLKASKFKQEEFRKELEELAKENASLANAVIQGISSFSHPIDIGMKLGEMFGRYRPFRNYHYFDSYHHILKNSIRTSRDGTFNEVEVLYFEDENDIEDDNIEDLVSNLEQLSRGSEGLMACQLDENIPEEYIRSYREEFPSCITDDMARRYIQGLFSRLLRDTYKGELHVLGEPSLKPYDVCYLNDASINMTGPIEVEQVEHIFNRDHGYISIITPDLCLDINDYYTATTLDLTAASMAYVYGLGGYSSFAPITALATGVGALGWVAGVKLIKYTQDGVPVIATPLVLNGKPLMSVSMGQKSGSLFMQWHGQWKQYWDDLAVAWNKFDAAEAIFHTGLDIQESVFGFLGADLADSIPEAEFD